MPTFRQVVSDVQWHPFAGNMRWFQEMVEDPSWFIFEDDLIGLWSRYGVSALFPLAYGTQYHVLNYIWTLDRIRRKANRLAHTRIRSVVQHPRDRVTSYARIGEICSAICNVCPFGTINIFGSILTRHRASKFAVYHSNDRWMIHSLPLATSMIETRQFAPPEWTDTKEGPDPYKTRHRRMLILVWNMVHGGRNERDWAVARWVQSGMNECKIRRALRSATGDDRQRLLREMSFLGLRAIDSPTYLKRFMQIKKK